MSDPVSKASAVAEARHALREAEIAEQIERYAKERAEWGACPKERHHFDLMSCLLGVFIGMCLGLAVVEITLAVTHHLG